MNNIIKQTSEWLTVSKPLPRTKPELLKELFLVKKLINEEVDEMIQGVIDDDRSEVLNGFVDSCWVLSNAFYYLQITDEEFESESDLVNKSNNTKYCLTLQEALETQRLYKEGKHPNKPDVFINTLIHTTSSDEFPYCIINHEGKVLKSHLFKDVSDLK